MDEPKQPKATNNPQSAGSPGQVEDFFQRLSGTEPLRRPKPSPESIAEALQAIQRMGAGSGLQEETPTPFQEPGPEGQLACSLCGYKNQRGSQFCGMCGAPIGGSAPPQGLIDAGMPRPNSAEGQHHYHHHYHHHYVAGGQETDLLSSALGQRQQAPSSPARDTPKPRGPLGGPAGSRAEAAVRQMTQDWALACNNKHLDDVLEFYASDALVLRPNVPAVRGAAAIREFFFAALDSGLGDIEMEALRVELFGDVAYEAGRCKMLVPFAVGKRREERGKYVVVFNKQAGEWKAVVDSWSSDLTLAHGEAEPQKPSAQAPPNVPPRSPRRI